MKKATASSIPGFEQPFKLSLISLPAYQAARQPMNQPGYLAAPGITGRYCPGFTSICLFPNSLHFFSLLLSPYLTPQPSVNFPVCLTNQIIRLQSDKFPITHLLPSPIYPSPLAPFTTASRRRKFPSATGFCSQWTFNREVSPACTNYDFISINNANMGQQGVQNDRHC